MYDVIDNKDRQNTIDKLQAVLTYDDASDYFGNSEDNDEKEEETIQRMYFNTLVLDYVTYNIPHEIYKKIVPHPNCSCSNNQYDRAIFVRK